MIKINTNIAALSFSIMSLLILTATIGPEAAAIKVTSTSYRDGMPKVLLANTFSDVIIRLCLDPIFIRYVVQ